MLSYRHHFHAGNHADVLKHLSLLALLDAVTRKPKPLCYFETHAGAGMYTIPERQAGKAPEFDLGAGRLLAAPCESALLQHYCALIKQAGQNAAVQHYPGSPWLAQSRLRENDEAVLCELHPADADCLRAQFAGKAQMHVHHRDGFNAIRALLPPAQSRGLVLIDPPYERKDDYRRCVDAVRALQQRFRAGIIALWYPRLPRDPAGEMLLALEQIKGVDQLRLQLDVAPPLGDFGMYGSGMVILRPPWGLRENLLPALAEAAARINPHATVQARMMNA